MSVEVARPKNFIEQKIDSDLENNVVTTVHTRFPPEPNGFLHIGHAKSICLNFGLAKEYNGTCNLRFDDTNPLKETAEFVEAIKKDVKWLGFKWDELRHSSDYFEQLYLYAKELISSGLAYVDELTDDEIRQYRGNFTTPGKNSPYRDRSISENLNLFEKMKMGGFQEGKACLRAKIDMSSSFMVMRDPVLYRVRFIQHHQTKDKWCIYPMYDFTHCISDAIENISHSLCTLEFQDNRRIYDWILDNISIKSRPHQYEFSRLNLEYTLTSKRKLSDLVEERFVDGWDDPRMPTISGLRRRGYTPASIREFCSRIGVTKQENTIELNALEACIREDLNTNARRVMAVLDPVKVIIENFDDQPFFIDAKNHPNNDEMGTRKVQFSREIWIEREDFKVEANKKFKRLVLGKEVRLRNCFVIKANDVVYDEYGSIKEIICTYDPNTLGQDPLDGRKVKGVIHWVSSTNAISAQFRVYEKLFNHKNPAQVEDFRTELNLKSLETFNGFVENSVKENDIEERYQFERKGYFTQDNKDFSKEFLIFNQIVGLRETNK
ncbi:glutamine--tRNA ligase [Paraphotobacterium marinum]|uniref:Glutamine--tRNA ligase n=1 Tax=Paraphotobacterium marinum TaxID=1755811 RepID=A0A220VDQ8_9GAMM|nr:glutamine--tRNA ligase [Paraphotobacterium marinum]ASK78534.1 glutamine--tRNA ligase [Paraphotobacterium marinum]